MKITQGTFSFLPDLTDAQIARQVDYALAQNWAVSVEYTDDPHPRNTFWEMFGNPMFDLRDPAGILKEINEARATFPNHYIRVTAFDSTHQVESVVLSFIVNRPAVDCARTAAAGAAAAGVLHHPVGDPADGTAGLQPALPLVRGPRRG